MRRLSRRRVALVTLLGMLGLQGALAAHACATTFLPAGYARAADTSMPPSAHCAAIAPKPAPQGDALCLEHCTKGKEASNASLTTDVPAPAAIASLTVPTVATTAIANSWSPPQLQSRNNSPPILATSPRLRI